MPFEPEIAHQARERRIERDLADDHRAGVGKALAHGGHGAQELFDAQEQLIGAAPSVPSDTEPGFTGSSVVVVDDNPIDRELIVSLVQEALPDARIQVAGNGFQGLVMIAKCAPQIVVTDIHMPHMDGFELIRNLLADAATRPRLLVAVSALSAQGLLEFGQLPSEVRLFTKPLDHDTFVDVVRREG